MEETSSRFEQLSVTSSVPRDMLWVTPFSIDYSQIYIAGPIDAKFHTKIRNVCYKYGLPTGQNEKANLSVTTSLDPDSYIICRGVYAQDPIGEVRQEESTGTSEPKKHICKFEIDLSVEGQREFMKTIEAVRKVTETLMERHTKGPYPLTLPSTYTEDGTKAFLYVDLIESSSGTIYSRAYNDQESLEIKDVKNSKVRPCFIFSNTERPKGKPQEGPEVNSRSSYLRCLFLNRSTCSLSRGMMSAL